MLIANLTKAISPLIANAIRLIANAKFDESFRMFYWVFILISIKSLSLSLSLMCVCIEPLFKTPLENLTKGYRT